MAQRQRQVTDGQRGVPLPHSRLANVAAYVVFARAWMVELHRILPGGHRNTLVRFTRIHGNAAMTEEQKIQRRINKLMKAKAQAPSLAEKIEVCEQLKQARKDLAKARIAAFWANNQDESK